MWYIVVEGVDFIKTTNYSLRLDPDIKAKAEKTFAEFGLNLSEAITVFLHMSIKRHGFPFEVALRESDTRLKESIAEADMVIAEIEAGTRKPFANAQEMFAAMDSEDEAEGAL